MVNLLTSRIREGIVGNIEDFSDTPAALKSFEGLRREFFIV